MKKDSLHQPREQHPRPPDQEKSPGPLTKDPLRESIRLFEDLVSVVHLIIWRTDADLRLTFINRRVEDFTGAAPENFHGTGWHEYVHPEDIGPAWESIQEAWRSRQPFTEEFRLRLADGSWRWVEDKGAPVLDDDGGLIGYVGSVQDIHDRRLREEQEQEFTVQMAEARRMESIGMLAGGIAHDFNNMLTAISGRTELALSEAASGGDVREDLEEVLRQTQRASDLCRQLLAYAGKGTMAVSDVDLAAVLRNCLQLLKSNVPSHVSLQLELLRKPCPFRGDWSQIVQSILNLVTNAVEAVGDRPGQILLRAGRSNSLLSGHKSTPVFLSDSPASGPFSWVEVEDTGCGIAPELAPRMFEPFYSTRFTGRGLGLPSVLGTVRSHEGGVAVFSKPGEGTVVRLAFPCAEEAATAAAAEASCSGHSAGRTILVVDDEEPVLEVTVRGLEKLGMETISATHGEEAVEKLRQAPGRIDAAIIDLTMPRMDGQTTLKALREIRPDLPAVMISGYSSTPTPLPHSGGAPLRFLAKPFRLQTLEAVLDAVLANR